MTTEETKTIEQRLAEPFRADQIMERPGRGSMTFSYVDAPLVMNRLDDVVGAVNWQTAFKVIDPQNNAVECTLSIRMDGEWISKADAGCPNSDNDDEPLKSAYSDALKRAAVQFGIGRHLREKKPVQRSAPRPVQAAQAPSAVATPEAASVPEPSSTFPGVTMINGDGSLNFNEFWSQCRKLKIDNTEVAKECGGDLNNLKTMDPSRAVDLFNLLRDRKRETAPA